MRKRDFRTVLALILWTFWMILVGRLDVGSIVVGLGVAVGLSLLNRDLAPSGAGRMPRGAFWGLAVFMGGLILEVIKANVQVAAIVLTPRLPITPTIATFRTRLTSDIGRMALGNSITLTPGTLTIDVDGDTFVVHALTRNYAQALGERRLERSLAAVEPGGDGR